MQALICSETRSVRTVGAFGTSDCKWRERPSERCLGKLGHSVMRVLRATAKEISNQLQSGPCRPEYVSRQRRDFAVGALSVCRLVEVRLLLSPLHPPHSPRGSAL